VLVLSLETRIKTRQALEQMIDSIDHWMSHGRRLDGIEPGMFPMAMTLCLSLLQGLINDLVNYVESRLLNASSGPSFRAWSQCGSDLVDW
jgi:hypothetical protein